MDYLYIQYNKCSVFCICIFLLPGLCAGMDVAVLVTAVVVDVVVGGHAASVTLPLTLMTSSFVFM